MKTLIAFVAINLVLAAANIAGAAVVLWTGLALQHVAPQFADSAWAWYAIGLLAATAGIATALLAAKAASGHFRRTP